MSSRRQRSIPIGGRNRHVSLYSASTHGNFSLMITLRFIKRDRPPKVCQNVRLVHIILHIFFLFNIYYLTTLCARAINVNGIFNKLLVTIDLPEICDAIALMQHQGNRAQNSRERCNISKNIYQGSLA